MLYHGTSDVILGAVASSGILPRQNTGRGNFGSELGVESLPEYTYLTDHLPGLYSSIAVRKYGGSWMTVEVDFPCGGLDTANFRPDEDYCEALKELGAHDAGLFQSHPRDKVIRAIRKGARAMVEAEPHRWQESLNYFGTVAVKGGVPISAISRISVYDPSGEPYAFPEQPQRASLIADIYCVWGALKHQDVERLRPSYQHLTAWLFGEPKTIDDIRPILEHRPTPGSDAAVAGWDLSRLLTKEWYECLDQVLKHPRARVLTPPFGLVDGAGLSEGRATGEDRNGLPLVE